MHPFEELNQGLQSFVDGEDQSVLLLTSTDVEMPIIAQALDGLDGRSPADVVVIEVAPVRSAAEYATAVVEHVFAELAEVNAARTEKAEAPLAPPPPACLSPAFAPADRLRGLFHHMLTWLPPDDGHRLVIALLPETIANPQAQTEILGGLIPLRGTEPWMRRLRLIVRDDGAAPFAEAALRNSGVKNVLVHRTQLTVSALADAVAREAENPDLPPGRRINALLQCASLDVALGRFEAALEKFGRLFVYYEAHKLPEMQAVAVQGTGDVMARVGRLPAARDRYLQALDLASDARAVHLICSIASAIGDLDMQLRAYAEAARSYRLAAGAAQKMANGYARADLLHKCGNAHAAVDDLRGAVEAWTAAANQARDVEYAECLVPVLQRLRHVAALAGYRETVAEYDAELADLGGRS